MIENYDSVDVFIGVGIGKGEYHAVAQMTCLVSGPVSHG
nr:hypothetical protein BJQ95_02254 [Cryobacterium sp. SO1]